MSVLVKGYNAFDSDKYKTMIIRKNQDGYVVDLSDKLRYSKTWMDNEKHSDLSIIKYFIRKHLDSTMIHEYIVKTRIPYLKGSYLVANGTKKLAVLVSEGVSKNVVDMIKMSYKEDRESFCYDELEDDIKFYDISLDSNSSSYEVKKIRCEYCKGCIYVDECDSGLYLKLLYKNSKLEDFEKEFISNFIYDKLTKIGKPATIMSENEYLGLNVNIFASSCICCGDIVIRFSNGYGLMFLMDVVEKYNNDRKKSYKKRKLIKEEI